MATSAHLRVAVLISGSGTNLQAIIDAQQEDELAIDLVAVISDKPLAMGLERARQAGIPDVAIDYSEFPNRTEYDNELEQTLLEVKPDLIVLAGYMRILADSTVNQFLGRMINIHPSLLPAYPGLHTYERVLEAGDSWHGTTVHFVIPELDAGPPILQYRVSVLPSDTESSLRERVLWGEHSIYPEVIGWFANNRLKLAEGVPTLDGKALRGPLVVDEPVLDEVGHLDS